MMERLLSDKQRIELVKDNCKRISEEVAEAAIKSGRKPEDVRLMAVTKTVEPVFINAAFECGINLMGENRVQEFLGKRDELKLDGVEKHLIGHLQKNKVRSIVGEVDMIESVDSVSLAQEISKRSAAKGIVTDVLLEVNVGNEESKFGFSFEEVEQAMYEIRELEAVRVRGLMSIPPICDDIALTRKNFAKMYKLYVDISSKIFNNINILSMGMSGDYVEAILEGSNLVRVGSKMFGNRIYR